MKDIKSVIRIIKKINYILTKKQKIDSIIVFLSMIASSLLELLGVSVVYPFLQLMLEESTEVNNPYVNVLKAIWPETDKKHIIIILGFTIALVYIIKNVSMLFCIYIQTRYASRINRELSVRMFDSYMKRPYEFFVYTHSSIIMRGLAGDVSSVYNIIRDGFQIVADLFSILLISAYLVKVDIFIAILSLLVSAIVLLVVTIGFKGTMKRLGQQLRRLQTESTGFTYQAIGGIKEITVLDRRRFFVEKFNSICKQIEKKMTKSGVVNATPDRVMEASCIAGVMAILCIRIGMNVDISTFIPALGAFVMGIFRIMPATSRISSRINSIVYFMPGLENTYVVIKDDEEIENNLQNDKEELTRQIEKNGVDTIEFNKELVIDRIFWRYKGNQEDVLKGLNMTIKHGESIGLIGTSGGGKSTLVDIIMTLFKPQKGSIRVDGIDIFLLKDKWRKFIGYVPQSIFLTSDTVRENVAFGLSKESISDEKVWKALEGAQLKEFVESLPDGLDTLVGERGINFSGGQKQRIAIARALYDEPQILILDEATAALDNETERAFMEAIDSLKGVKTIILVAHRLTTVRNCNRVYEIRDGIAIERDVQEVVNS